MRKVVFLIVLFSGIAGLSRIQAQTSFKQELMVGPAFGVNFSSVSFAPNVKTKLLMGYLGGVTLRWTTEKNIGIQAEVNFSQNGWDEKFEMNPEYKYTRTINYLELPIMTHIYVGGKRARFFFNLGPKVGYMMSESTSSFLPDEDIPGEKRQRETPVENKFSWGLCGGPGFELRTGIGTFNLEGRYSYGLGDLFKSHNKKGLSKSSGQVFGVKLAYLIPIF